MQKLNAETSREGVHEVMIYLGASENLTHIGNVPAATFAIVVAIVDLIQIETGRRISFGDFRPLFCNVLLADDVSGPTFRKVAQRGESRAGLWEIQPL